MNNKKRAIHPVKPSYFYQRFSIKKVDFDIVSCPQPQKFDNAGEDMEDLISIGTIGLIKAIESYRPNKGTKLATFAARCIENEILMHLRSLQKTRKDVSRGCPRSGRHPVFRWREAWRISTVQRIRVRTLACKQACCC